MTGEALVFRPARKWRNSVHEGQKLDLGQQVCDMAPALRGAGPDGEGIRCLAGSGADTGVSDGWPQGWTNPRGAR
jgi:hypothetical protein